MPHEDLHSLLGVKWYDGLLVRSHHLLHTDNRAAALFSEAAGLGSDQPGILDIGPGPSGPSQLVKIGKFHRGKDSGAAKIALGLLRPFRSLAPDGSLILAIPNDRGAVGVPTTGVEAEFRAASGGVKNGLVCIRQESREDLGLKTGANQDRSVELTYPGIQVEIVPYDRYVSHLRSDLRDSTPIALLSFEGDQAQIDSAFIPPVVRLKLIEFFEPGALDSLASSLNQLLEISSEYVAAGRALYTRTDVEPGIVTRYNSYQILNAILLGKSGLFSNLGDMSPAGFLRDVMHPLARWLDQYWRGLEERRSNLSQLSDAGAGVRELTVQDLCARTDNLLLMSRDLIHRVNDAIGEIG